MKTTADMETAYIPLWPSRNTRKVSANVITAGVGVVYIYRWTTVSFVKICSMAVLLHVEEKSYSCTIFPYLLISFVVIRDYISPFGHDKKVWVSQNRHEKCRNLIRGGKQKFSNTFHIPRPIWIEIRYQTNKWVWGFWKLSERNSWFT